jgi:hypothetical protein
MKVFAFLFLTIFVLEQSLYATHQIPDTIIYNGVEYELQAPPLEGYFKRHPASQLENAINNAKITITANSMSMPVSSALNRGYIASFSITNKIMYLTDISVISHFDKSDNHSKYRSVFREIIKDEQPKTMDYFSGILVIAHGEIVKQGFVGAESLYTLYIILEVSNGVVTDKKEFQLHEYQAFKSQQLQLFKKTKPYKDIFDLETNNVKDYLKSNENTKIITTEIAEKYIEANLFNLLSCLLRE